MGRIQDKVAIVTGGGDGIGHGICRRFAREGAKLVIAELNPKDGQRVAEEVEKEFGVDAAFIETDVSDKAANIAMVDFAKQRFGGRHQHAHLCRTHTVTSKFRVDVSGVE